MQKCDRIVKQHGIREASNLELLENQGQDNNEVGGIDKQQVLEG